jgi:hypothetical protein
MKVWLFQVGLCVLAWYWMDLNSPRIVISKAAGLLTPSQAEFWNRTYKLVLAEFCFFHDIPCGNLVIYPNCSAAPSAAPAGVSSASNSSSRQVLIPLGGGKDSLTVFSLLHASGVLCGDADSGSCSDGDNGEPREGVADEGKTELGETTSPACTCTMLYIGECPQEYVQNWRLGKMAALCKECTNGQTTTLVLEHDFDAGTAFAGARR